MFPLAGPLITGGASLLGSIFSSQTSAQNTEEQMQNNLMMQQNSEQFNAQQAQQQRDYETQMSNTAYQRASADMTKAGLNPMMMFGSGGAASTPSGATASVGTGSAATPQRTSPFAGIGQAVTSAVDTMVKDKQIDMLAGMAAKANADAKVAGGPGFDKATSDAAISAAGVPGARAQGELDQYWKAFIENHPDIATATAVGPKLGRAADETLSPAFDAVSSVYGGLGKVLGSTLGGALRSSAGGEPSAAVGGTAKRYSLPGIRQSWKDAGMTDDQYDNFVQALKDNFPK